jgi:hypothetical protein
MDTLIILDIKYNSTHHSTEYIRYEKKKRFGGFS